MTIRLFLLLSVVALHLGCATKSTVETESRDLQNQLVGQLQQGGLVLFFRHAATYPDQQDTDPQNPDNCESQRRLNEYGKSQAVMIGEGFKKLQIPLGEVITSRYCRCVNTAILAFGRASPTIDLTSIQAVSQEERARRTNTIREWLGRQPQVQVNNVLIGHMWMFKDASGEFLVEGEAAVFKPMGNSQFQLLGKIKAEEWAQLRSGG